MSRAATTIAALIAFLVLAATPASALGPWRWDRNQINRLRTTPVRGAWPLHLRASEWAAHLAATGWLADDVDGAAACWRMGGHYYGSNVGVGTDVPQVQAAFEASPEHLANITNPHYRRIGLGIVEAGGSVWVVQSFCG